MTHRIPRALHSADSGPEKPGPTPTSGFDEHAEHQVVELHSGLDEVLAAVRQTAAELLAQSPQRPTTLTVRAGAVAVELAWDVGAAPTPTVVEVLPTASAATEAASGEVLAASTVGVFYRSSAPGSAPFVEEGDQVVPGQQVAIIEAMKLMLPVEADRPGRIVEVLVKNGASVEFGQPLFRLAPIEH